MKKLFRYSALVLGLVLSAFFLLMSMDSFPGSFDPKEIIGFLIHMIPAFILIPATIISFRFPLAGVYIFSVLTIAATVYFRTYSNIQLFLIVSLPLLIIMILFFSATQAKQKKKLK